MLFVCLPAARPCQLLQQLDRLPSFLSFHYFPCFQLWLVAVCVMVLCVMVFTYPLGSWRYMCHLSSLGLLSSRCWRYDGGAVMGAQF